MGVDVGIYWAEKCSKKQSFDCLTEAERRELEKAQLVLEKTGSVNDYITICTAVFVVFHLVRRIKGIN